MLQSQHHDDKHNENKVLACVDVYDKALTQNISWNGSAEAQKNNPSNKT